MELDQKVIVISGGGSGLGAATAEYLSQQGAICVCLDLSEASARTIADKINGLAVACDVSDANSAEQAVQHVIEKLGSIHGCVNCAGICPGARLVGREGPLSLGDFNRVIQVNLVGTFNIMRLCAAHMMQQSAPHEDSEKGVIINTASIAAFEGQIGQVAYSASKGGVVAMTLPVARELSRYNIRVMTIAPGVMATPMMEGLPEKVSTSLSDTVPFPARLGNPNEFAMLVAHIFRNTYLNGGVIRLDGAIRMTAK